ncbi:MAG: ABC transporter ATP-binding protein [Planctomycetota bacterium]|nr:ABC transporter ATP-binding protein [Planctomycetota bacterium]
MAQPPTASPLALQVTDLRAKLPHGFGKREILRGLNLELEAGQTLGLLGPNGSGKSTLMRHLAGLLRPHGGQVLILGGHAHQPESLTRAAYLPEDSPFPDDLNGLQALGLLASLRGRRDKAALLAAMERAGLGSHPKTKLGRYSRGMLRRFGLAQAFLFEPELVLLDEPSAGLDAPGLTLLQDWIQEHQARGGSLVLASHVVSELASLTDRLAVLMDGQIVCEGPTLEILGAPDKHSIEVHGMDADLEEKLGTWLGEQGAQGVKILPALRDAIDIYHGARSGDGR